MTRMKPCVLVLAAVGVLLTASPARTDEIQKLMQSVYQKHASALAMVRCEIQNPAGSGSLSGTAICIDPSGVMMTSAISPRVDPEDITSIELTLPGGETKVPAKLMGIDPLTGLAFLQAQGGNFSAVPFLQNSSLQIGDPVCSIGLVSENASLPIEMGAAYVGGFLESPDTVVNVTGGRLSSTGSVVFNTKGQAIGLVSGQPYFNLQTLSRQGAMNLTLRDNSRTVSFLPVEEFAYVLSSIPRDGKVRRLPWIGVGRFSPIRPDLAEAKNINQPAVMIDEVIPGYAADSAGLESRDLIIAVDGKPLKKLATPELVTQAFSRELMRKSIGEDITLTIVSGQERRDVTLKLQPMPKLPDEAPQLFDRRLGVVMREKVMLDKYLDKSQTAQVNGLLVRGVANNSPAALAGLQQGDVVTKINDVPVVKAERAKELIDEALEKVPPADVRMEVQRGTGSETIIIRTTQGS